MTSPYDKALVECCNCGEKPAITQTLSEYVKVMFSVMCGCDLTKSTKEHAVLMDAIAEWNAISLHSVVDLTGIVLAEKILCVAEDAVLSLLTLAEDDRISDEVQKEIRKLAVEVETKLREACDGTGETQNC